MHTMNFLTMATVLLAAAQLLPAETRKPTDLATAVKRAAQIAEQKDYKRILVVVRGEFRANSNLANQRTLQGFEDAIVRSLKVAKADVVVSPDVDQWFSKTKISGRLRLTHYHALEELAQFDILLSVRYRVRGKSRSLQLALMDYRKRIWSQSVNLTREAAKTTVPRSKKQPGAIGASTSSSSVEASAISRRDLSTLPLPNRKVLAFALAQLGKKVGNGECWTLGADALRFAGAQPPVGYTFGRLLKPDQIQPGDILQFFSAKFQNGDTAIFLGAPDHTAIIESVQGTRLTILHQNFGQRIVTRLILDVSKMTAGRVSGYRPMP